MPERENERWVGWSEGSHRGLCYHCGSDNIEYYPDKKVWVCHNQKCSYFAVYQKHISGGEIVKGVLDKYHTDSYFACIHTPNCNCSECIRLRFEKKELFNGVNSNIGQKNNEGETGVKGIIYADFKCPVCGGKVIVRKLWASKTDKFYACENYSVIPLSGCKFRELCSEYNKRICKQSHDDLKQEEPGTSNDEDVCNRNYGKAKDLIKPNTKCKYARPLLEGEKWEDTYCTVLDVPCHIVQGGSCISYEPIETLEGGEKPEREARTPKPNENLAIKRDSIEQSQKNPAPIKAEAKSDVKCPVCGSTTKLRTAKKDGRKFYVCVKYPRCKGRIAFKEEWGNDW